LQSTDRARNGSGPDIVRQSVGHKRTHHPQPLQRRSSSVGHSRFSGSGLAFVFLMDRFSAMHIQASTCTVGTWERRTGRRSRLGSRRCGEVIRS
jgi:hypothetical protein